MACNQGDACSTSANENLGTDSGAALSCNASTIDKVVNGGANDTVVSRTGKSLATLQHLEQNYIMSAVNGGIWQAGQTFTAYNQYMVFGGTAYKPKASTTLPYTVAGSPDVSFVEPVSEQDFERNIKHYTLAEAKSLIGATIKQRAIITDRGDAPVEVVSASTHTPDELGVIAIAGTNLAWKVKVGVTANVEWFGAKTGDLDFNSQPAIQYCVDICAPFPWLGTVSATRANGKSVAKMVSRGVFRVDDPILLNPFLDWDAGGVGGFFYARPSAQDQDNAISVGTMLYPFFSNKEQWVVDTNPYNASGQRNVPAKTVIQNPQFDALEYTLMHGIKIQGLAVVDDSGTGIFGGLRLLGAIESEVDGVLSERFFYPYMEMCCWGHTRGRVHTTGFHAGFTSVNGTIGVDRGGCYFTGSGDFPPTELTVGDWWQGVLDTPPLNPADKAYLRTGMYFLGSDTFPSHTILSPITEGWERAYMCVGCSLKVIKPYIEANTVVGCHGWNATVEFEQPFLFNPNGGGVGADDLPFFYVSNGYWSVDKPLGDSLGRLMDYTNDFAEIHITNAPPCWIKDYPYSKYRNGADGEFRPSIDFNGLWSVGEFDIYVDNAGNNNNYGTCEDYPLKNGERILQRVIPSSSVNLLYSDEQSHGVNGTDISNKDLKIAIKRKGGGATRPVIFKELSFGQVYGAYGLDSSSVDVGDVVMQSISGGSIDPTYQAMFRISGACSIDFNDTGIELQSGKALFSPFFNKSGIITATFDGCSIDGYDSGGVTYGSLSSNNFGNQGKMSVIDEAQGTSINASILTYSSDTNKIASRLFP